MAINMSTQEVYDSLDDWQKEAYGYRFGDQYKTPAVPTAESAANIAGGMQNPYGNAIPIFRGSAKFRGSFIWGTEPDSEGYHHVAYAFAENVFDKDIKLLRMWAGDDQIFGPVIEDDGSTTNISKAEAIQKYFDSGLEYSFYNGQSNPVDTLIEAEEGEDNTTSFPRMVYIVFRNVRYGTVISAEVSDTHDTASGTHTLDYTTSLGDYDVDAGAFAVDFIQGLLYQFITDGSGNWQIVTLSLAERAELYRVPIDADGALDFISPVAIPGTDLVLVSWQNPDGGANLDQNWLVNTRTGEALDSVEDIGTSSSTGDSHHVLWRSVVPFVGPGGTRFLAFGAVQTEASGLDHHNKTLAMVNATAGTLEYLSYIEHGDAMVSASTTLGTVPGRIESGLSSFIYAQSGPNDVWEISYNGSSVSARQVYDPPSGTVTGVHYEPSDDTVLVSMTDTNGDEIAVKVERGSGDVQLAWALPASGRFDLGHTPSSSTRMYQAGTGYAFVRVGTSYYIFNTRTGIYELWGSSISGSDGLFFSRPRGAYYEVSSDSPNWTEHASGTVTPGLITLESVFTDLCSLIGYSSGNLSFANFTGLEVYGLVLANDTSLRNTIAQTARLYGIAVVERPGGMRFVAPPRDAGFAVDKALSLSDLQEREEGQLRKTIDAIRPREGDILSEGILHSLDPDNDYQVTPQTFRRPNAVFDTTSSFKRDSLNPPLVLKPDQARELITNYVYKEVFRSEPFSFEVQPSRLDLEPGDIVTFPFDEISITAQIDTSTINADYTQSIEAYLFLQNVASNVEGSDVVTITKPLPASGTSQYIHLDMPNPWPAFDLGGAALLQFHVITGKGQANWPGGDLFRSESGTAYERVDTFASDYPTIGVLTAALPEPPTTFVQDDTNELTIRVTAGVAADLSNSTTKLFALGAPGRWMIGDYDTVSTNSPDDGIITLTGIRQGGYGTEVHQGTSQAGDTFVLLESHWVRKLAYELTDLDAEYYFKPIGGSLNLVTVPAVQHTISGAAEKPFAPWELDAAIDGSDIDLTWTRRDRFEGFWPVSSPAPDLNEATEEYKVEILSADGASVVRTVENITTPSYTYESADITSDFGSMPNLFRFRVYQIGTLDDGTEITGHAASKATFLSGLTADTADFTADTALVTADQG